LDDRGRFVLDVAKDDKTEYTSAANVLFREWKSYLQGPEV
jgi:hypothetical protein